MLISSLLESIGIGLIIPLISIVSDPEIIFEYLNQDSAGKYLFLETKNQIVTSVFILFMAASTFITLIKFCYAYCQMRFATLISLDLSQQLFKGALRQKYSSLILMNESDFLTTQSVKVNQVLMNIIVPSLTITSSLILSLLIFLLLIIVDTKLSLIVILGFLSLYITAAFLLKKRIKTVGDHINSQQNHHTKLIRNAFGSRRDIILYNLEGFFENIFYDIDQKLRSAHAKIDFYRTSPRYFVEYGLTVGFCFLAIYYFYIVSDDLQNNLAKLTAIALASVRVLPMVQNVFASWFNIKTFEDTLNDVIAYLSSLELSSSKNLAPSNDLISFKKNILLENASLKFQEDDQFILDNVTLNIDKGERIAIMGESGSGKSSLVDIIMGLIKPLSGSLFVDGIKITDSNIRSWMDKISHVPQELFIANKTIAENIALGSSLENIDEEKIFLSINLSFLSDFIGKQEGGLYSVLGDGTNPISGGEKQRLGIARAFYRSDFELLVLDESTSSLDSKTELEVINSILSRLSKKITVIMITHRRETASKFDKIYEIKNRRINLLTDL